MFEFWNRHCDCTIWQIPGPIGEQLRYQCYSLTLHSPDLFEKYLNQESARSMNNIDTVVGKECRST